VGQINNVFSKNGQTYEKKEIVLIDSDEKVFFISFFDSLLFNIHFIYNYR